MIQKIQIRISNRGVPHTIITTDMGEYSFCFMGKEKFYRVWEWETQKKIGDIPLLKGDMVDVEEWLIIKLEELIKSEQNYGKNTNSF